MTVGEDFVRAFVEADPADKKSYSVALPPLDFFWGEERTLWQYLASYMAKHGKRPPVSILETETGTLLAKHDKPVEYLADKLRDRFQERTIKTAMLDSEALFKESRPVSEVLDTLRAGLARTLLSSDNVYAVKDSVVDVFDQHKAILLGAQKVIRSPWSTFNENSVGALPQDLLSMVGPTGTGKTYHLLNFADHAYNVDDATSLLVSMEMGYLAIMSRIIAMRTKTPASIVTGQKVSTGQQANIKAHFADLAGDYMHIIDAQFSSTVSDVASVAQSLSPDIVIIDGAYLLDPTEKQNSKWEAVKAVAEGLKKEIGIPLNIPVVASWQLNTEGSKQAKKGGVAGTENVGGSGAISHASSVMLEMVKTEHLTPQGEEIDATRFTNTKNRDGHSGSKWLTGFDFKAMDFDELDEIPGELQ